MDKDSGPVEARGLESASPRTVGLATGSESGTALRCVELNSDALRAVQTGLRRVVQGER